MDFLISTATLTDQQCRWRREMPFYNALVRLPHLHRYICADCADFMQFCESYCCCCCCWPHCRLSRISRNALRNMYARERTTHIGMLRSPAHTHPGTSIKSITNILEQQRSRTPTRKKLHAGMRSRPKLINRILYKHFAYAMAMVVVMVASADDDCYCYWRRFLVRARTTTRIRRA